MNRKPMIIAVAIVVVSAWAAGAGAVEGGWFEAVDRLERESAEAAMEARQFQRRSAEIDEHLSTTLTDADTARRVDRDLRRDVASEVARWHATMRDVERARWGDDANEARMMRRVLVASQWPASPSWRRDVRLVGELADGIDDAGQLMMRRTALDVWHAHRQAVQHTGLATRQWVVARASDQGDDEAIDEEVDDLAQALDAELERLRPTPSDEDFHRRKGALVPPVAAAPEHPFGPRQREGSYTEMRHTGVTYAVDVGTEVRSVAQGDVAYAQRLAGYGNLIIVDHGDEYHSLYAHLDEFMVEVGDAIEAREVIARSGESGSLEGPKLYFELRRQGRPVDPEEWFVRQ